MKPVIEVKNLTKKYHEFLAVDDLSFRLNEGEILGFLGPNGSGKTTTLNCLLSLLKYNKGDILLFGKRMTTASSDLKKDIGVVFQEVALFYELTVWENLDYFCGLYITDKKEREKCLKYALELTQLDKFKNFYPKELSGGLLRRLNIACGVAHQPKLIFLDEPTALLDPQSRNNILEGIKKLRDSGSSIIYTTHYMEEAEILCDRIIILDKGKIIGEGTSDELKELTSINERIKVEVNNLDKKIIKEIKNLKNVKEVCYKSNLLNITYTKGVNNLSNLIEFLKEKGHAYNKIYSERPTLNDVFLELTGKELRDNVSS